MIGSQKHSRVSVSILDATQVSLDGEEDASVSGAAVLQQGGGGLPGALRDSAVEGGSWKRSTGGGSGERAYSGTSSAYDERRTVLFLTDLKELLTERRVALSSCLSVGLLLLLSST